MGFREDTRSTLTKISKKSVLSIARTYIRKTTILSLSISKTLEEKHGVDLEHHKKESLVKSKNNSINGLIEKSKKIEEETCRFQDIDEIIMHDDFDKWLVANSISGKRTMTSGIDFYRALSRAFVDLNDYVETYVLNYIVTKPNILLLADGYPLNKYQNFHCASGLLQDYRNYMNISVDDLDVGIFHENDKVSMEISNVLQDNVLQDLVFPELNHFSTEHDEYIKYLLNVFHNDC